MPHRTRPRAEEEEDEETRHHVKQQRTESVPAVQDETPSLDHVVTTVAAAWDSNDRYMRRKKREHLHEMMAAQAALQQVEKQRKKEKKRKVQVDILELKESAEEIEQDKESPRQEERGKTMDRREFNSPDRGLVTSSMHQTRVSLPTTLVMDPTIEKRAPAVAMTRKKNVARGIAQSSSSTSTRKRMISFSPERTLRTENQALALKKLEKNLKTNERLQQRLKAPTPVKRPALSQMASPQVVTPTRRPISFTSPQTRRQSPQARQTMAFTSPSSQRPVFQSPNTAASCSLALSQTEELDYGATQGDQNEELEILSTEVLVLPTDFESDIVMNKRFVETSGDKEVYTAENEEAELMHSQKQIGFSQESVSAVPDKLAPLSQESCDSNESHAMGDTMSDHTDNSSGAFTSTSVIGDVGLFNCETDVEYTGGVYGEGTDGKVTAAVINGQKVALKRAKPHDGFPDHEAKRRAAFELHYLRRVRHMKGFLQCLGLCDAIEHTCIVLEVMDCKLSDYLRRYGVNSGGSKHRRYTLSFDDTKAMLKQICLPMITLHEDINVAHGDLACRNILMRTPPEGYEQSWEPDIKLSDFGRIKLPLDEPKILDSSFSFHKNCDVGAFGREILYRLLVGEVVPKEHVETRSLHKLLQDVTVTQVPEAARARLGPYFSLFMRCTAWGVRPTFREIYEHLDDLDHFETSENGLFPLKPTSTDSTFMSPVAEGIRQKTSISSASRAHKRDTPTGPSNRLTGPKSRLFSSKSFTEASVPGPSKPVNWLKTRSVGVQRPVAPQVLTPITRQRKKKTPPSAGAGASRRSLQILNQIQHRTIEKGRKST